jgi:hypothetical protein
MAILHGGQLGQISYDGRTFRSAAAETADHQGAGPLCHYHQEGDVVWAEFAGGRVVRGCMAGRSDHDGVLHFAYCQVLDDGNVMSGRCTSYPTVHADGRIRLEEHWERFGEHAATGTSVIEEPPPATEP